MKHKRYIISGAGSGIGRAIAIKLASEGAGIILAGRNEKKLEETLKLLPDGNHLVISTDIRRKENCEEVSAILNGTHLDGIIANAGVGGENYYGEEDRWNEIIDTNLSGTYYFVNAFLPQLKESNAPIKHVLLTSSVLAKLGVKNYTAYCASKAGLLGLMRSWAMELAEQNILVNAISPGWVNTNMAKEGMNGIANGLGITMDEFHKIAMQSVPLGRMAEPEEIAELVNYLLRQKAMTGQVIDINCGSVMSS
ncbi:MAG: SDR family oxidoreductase [Bacteroidota bacterium]|nr:SDR family oxidoreductase [Bacteroidota bacterium]